MIWLTWRQFRVQAATLFGFLALLMVVLAFTGPELASDYSSGIAACGADEDACERFAQQFFADHQPPFFVLLLVMLLLPAVIGLFWGAPLIARELETGTHRLVWNQSVTRTHWLAVKLGFIGLATVAAAGIGTLAVTWWAEPIDKSAVADVTRLSPLLFDARGIAVVGYAAFAFVLGVTVGMVVRRTLVAMSVTLVVFAVVQVVMPLLVRPHLMTPVTANVTYTSKNLRSLVSEGPGAPIMVRVASPDPTGWVLSNETVDRSGKVVQTVPFTHESPQCQPRAVGEDPPPQRTAGGSPAIPPRPPGPPQACLDAINNAGYRQRVVYHPGDRFWPLQWIETGIYVALAGGMAGFSFWWLRRRVS